MRNALCLAYYFPPIGGIGAQRALKFAHYLPDSGWHPVVVSPQQGSYYQDTSLVSATNARFEIIRTKYIDLSESLKRLASSSKYIAEGGRPGAGCENAGPVAESKIAGLVKRGVRTWLYIPDGQIGWYPFAVRAGLRLMRSRRMDCIFSTSFPITAHLAAWRLKRLTGKPWVADFRDPWTGNTGLNYSNGLRNRLDGMIEKHLLRAADAVVTVSEGLGRSFRELGGGRGRIEVIRNGFDSADFAGIPSTSLAKWTVTYLATHFSSGNPEPFLKVLRRLVDAGSIDMRDVLFRIVGDPAPYVAELVKLYQFAGVTEFTGFLSHRACLTHQVASSLILFIAFGAVFYPGCITGKVFEHLGARRPILAITRADYEVAHILRETGAGTVVEPDDEAGIERCLLQSYAAFKAGRDREPLSSELFAFERSAGARQLAQLLTEVTERSRPNRNFR